MKAESAVADQKIEKVIIGALCAAAVVGLLNNMQLAPFIPDIAEDLGRTTPVIGQAATVYLVMAALGGLVVGPLADHYGHRRMLVVGLSLAAISSAGGGFAPNFTILLVTRMVGGLGLAATIGVVFAMVSSRYTGPSRLRALSIVTGAISLTMVVGVPALTGVSAWLDWRGAWIFVAVLSFLAIVALLAFSPADVLAGGERITAREIFRSYQPLLRSRRMLALFGGTASQGMLFVATMTYQGAFFIDERGLSVQQFGIVAAVGGAAFAGGSIVAGQLGRFDLRILFSLSTALSGVWVALGYGFGTNAIIAMVLLSAGFFLAGISVVTILDLLSNTTPGGQATTLVVNESVFSVGAALGAAAGGLLIGIGGFGALSVALPVFGLGGALLVWRPGIAPAALAQPE